ncbi:Acyl transferase/acyl hydrolase/lysophospholipase [Penicillium macrosclerotiorum]|uniref:Acyl transferase/acyl hydrolase/lysophospholipase n=1 Tax=Penicillium macrosclerotiorum TaxID=303699 RepID=UPI002548527D|nr:Acyl transferase/acyl hydrolase/lysophospholipase [Penicillium macrosclerotiorum]KAJ5668938.1 Acyl transferase/acyl hydrolase/lysophospholipase [Penicillium macrosclerotiorum]
MRPLSLANAASTNGGVPADTLEPIAVVGLATKFPQHATTTEALWEQLLQARSTWSSIPKERFNAEAFYHPDPDHGGTFHVQGGHFLNEDPALFDGSFFNISKTELLTLDPQQRLVMENVYHALENAGIPMINAVGSNTSVFVSGFNHDHLGILNSDSESAIKYKPTGVTNAILSNRVSWFFDFKGPSMTIDTACSSSLVALHLAVQSLRARETNMAIVSGVSILENPAETIGMSHHGLLGAEGRSFSFDSRAEGYARGEGVGTVVLKPLRMAIRDGDTIRAIIRETGVNQDGRTPGITVPSADAQEKLIREVYWRAGLDMTQTRFVEAHGTGTSTGDPIEAAALARAFKCRRGTPLYIGTIKSTIGHLEGGSGVASIIKSILILESGIIPPNYDIQDINTKIPASDWNIAFPKENTPWPSDGLRRISINSFGIGGTNAHCVLDDAYHYLADRHISASHHTTPSVPQLDQIEDHIMLISQSDQSSFTNISASVDDGDHSGSSAVFADTPITDDFCLSPSLDLVNHAALVDIPHIFLLSAFDEEGVKRNASTYAAYLNKASSDHDASERLLNQLSFTLSQRRSIFPWKSFVTGSTTKELAWNLSESNFTKPVRVATPPDTCFVFTGQGAQYQTMGRALMAYPVFQESIEDASKYIQRLGSPWSLIDELLAERKSARVNFPEIAHPLCTALQVALVDLFASWGIFPRCVIGHSSGEIAAAYCAGKITREGAWKAAYFRGYVSSKQLMANGAMMAVALDASQLENYLELVRQGSQGELIIACYNSPKNNTVSGDEALVDSLKKLLDADGIFARKLIVQNAYHSAHMVAIAGEYLDLMGNLYSGRRLAVPHVVHMFSTLTGQEVKNEHLPGSYWLENLISPVRFTVGLTAMYARARANAGSDNLPYVIEMGPHSTLQSAIKETLPPSDSQPGVKYLAVLKRNDPTLNVLISTIGFLAASGYPLDLHKINLACRPQLPKKSKFLVDLPPYSFKHTEKILYESRLSRNLRFRKYPRHDLFGAPAVDCDSNNPRWRHFVRLNENPWLRDHMVTGNYVYPGVGYLIMAIESSRQLAGDKMISGFRLRQVSIKRALIVPDTKEGIEVSISMMKIESTPESRQWRRFQISSFNNSSDEWTEHCHGYIAVEYATTPDPIDDGRVANEETEAWREDLRKAHDACTRPMNFQNIYDNMQASGLNFGPLFRNLDNVKASVSKLGMMTGSVTVPDIAQSMPKQYMHSHLIHPATMDSMIHMMIAAVLDFTGRSTLDQIKLPTFIREVWVSGDLKSVPQHKFTGHASVSATEAEKFEGKIRMLDHHTRRNCILMDGIELTPLESGLVEDNKRQLCTQINWKPDVHFLDSKSANALVSFEDSDHDQNLYWVQRLQLASMLYVVDALDELRDSEVLKLDLHFQRFYDWMKHSHEKLIDGEMIHLSHSAFSEVYQNDALKRSIYKELESHSAESAIASRMGRNIVRIMRQEVDPLHLMFGQDNLMEEVYKEGLQLFNLPKYLHSHLALLEHKHSGLNVLEIGGGTGSFTAEVLSVLSPLTGASKGSISTYTFTDISSGFFEKAKKRFQPWSDMMTFQTLNIESNPADQGIRGKYDLIFAGNVIHATANLNVALRNIRSLLRPGGQLIMQEGIRQDFLWYPLVFGQLPGWWLGNEPIREWCPYIPATEWDKLLQQTGFSGVDIEYQSSADKDLSWQSIMVATAVEPEQKRPLKDVFILTSENISTRTAKTAESITQLLSRDPLVANVEVLQLGELSKAISPNTICISLIDLDKKFLSDMVESEFLKLQQMLIQCDNVLWVMPEASIQPHSHMSLGLLRTVRWERDSDGSNIVTLAVQNIEDVKGLALENALYDIAKQQFFGMRDADRHAEYILRDGFIEIGRLREWQEVDDFLAVQSSSLVHELRQLGDVDRPIELSLPAPGSRDVHWITDKTHSVSLDKTEVEVSVQAVGLSSEIMTTHSSNEAAGFVNRVGSDVTDFVPGDKVAFLTSDEHGSCFRTLARVDHQLVVKLPEQISFETAAGLPSIYVAAIYGLAEIARLSEDDTILIQSGASAIGQAAIQYAKTVNATIFTTVHTIEDRELLVSEYGILQHQIFSANDLSFVKGVMRSTDDNGVDVIFNSIVGEASQESLACLAPFGRCVDVSNRTTPTAVLTGPSTYHRNWTVSNIDISLLVQKRPKIIRRLLRETLKLFVDGKISPVLPMTMVDCTQITEYLPGPQSTSQAGKTVVKLDPSNLIALASDALPPYHFDANASYILAGGLGGIGRSAARWMASRGAKHIIFLSRSNRMSEPVKEMMVDLQELGCSPHLFMCDICDADQLKAVVAQCSESMPPIKGCIQGSMVLQDGAFAGMSFDDWNLAVRPKVRGSWNLHKILPDGMDFFVMLSSVAGIFGNRGQSNYAAGNTFQDALAVYRMSQGCNASSVNLGSVSNVGWVAENRTSMRTQTSVLFETLREDEVHASIEFLIDPRRDKAPSRDKTSRSRLVLGLPTADTCRSNAIPIPTYLNYSLFTHLRSTAMAKASDTAEQKSVSTAALLAATTEPKDALSVVSNGIVERLSSLLAIPTSEIDVERFGFAAIDSLVAMEFRSWIVKDLKADVSLLDIMGAQNIRSLSEKIIYATRLLVHASS